jgi:hypothetical protein
MKALLYLHFIRILVMFYRGRYTHGNYLLQANHQLIDYDTMMSTLYQMQVAYLYLLYFITDATVDLLANNLNS